MRSPAEDEIVQRLILDGMNNCAIARATGIPRTTVRDMRRRRRKTRVDSACPLCGGAQISEPDYAYLLGLYLGDGCLSKHARDVYRLRISLDARQPGIVADCAGVMATVGCGRRVHRQLIGRCVVVGAYWKHWPCLFPQHGAGRKHRRRIELVSWQAEITRRYPDQLLRGLIQSDGCRVLNRVNGKTYPRYHFSNRSLDILRIFCMACEDYDVSWTRQSWKEISVARKADVARLDGVIGQKA